MTPARHRRAKEVYLAALEEADATARARLVAAACGDDAALRAEVASLLAHAADDTAESASAPSAPTTPSSPSRPTTPTGTGDGGFAAGDVYAGRYRVVALLGRGGMAEVYRVHDLVLDQEVALKRVAGATPAVAARLVGEVRLARRVSHPNVCRVYDVGHHQTAAGAETYLTMEYVDGEDLASLVRRIGRLPAGKLTDVARQLCAGLAAAHARGVVHRDLKPANVMLDGRGRVRITDFGIAVPASPEAAGEAPARAGTPGYMAPEQLVGERATEKSDLYALGLVLYAMATGRRAYADGSDGLRRQLLEPPAPPSALVPDLDPRLEEVILRCLERQPERRPASALAVAAALPGADPLSVAAEAGVTPPPEVVAAAGDRTRGVGARRALAATAATVALLAAVLALAEPAFHFAAVGLERPPAVLADRAGELLRTLGEDAAPGDRAWGFVEDLRAGSLEGALVFWYRESPEPMRATDVDNVLLFGARVHLGDPPPTESGMTMVQLEPDGRFVYLERVNYVHPDDYLDLAPPDLAGPDAAAIGDADGWAPLLAAAGLAEAELEPVAPEGAPPFYADRRAAWEGDDPRRPGRRIHVEAATLAGRPAFFELRTLHDDRAAVLAGEASILERWELQAAAWSVLLLLPLLLAPLAVFELRRGRGDRRGTLRLVTATSLVHAAAWLLAADHVRDVEGEAALLLGLVASTLLAATTLGIAYVALEPWARRLWPRTLVAWQRLLAGRVRDPTVGRALLVGVPCGVLWTLLLEIDRLLPARLGLESVAAPFDSIALDAVMGTRALFAVALECLLAAVYDGLLALLLLVGARVVARRALPAMVLFAVGFGLLQVIEGAHPVLSWLPLGLGIGGTAALLLVRGGLLAHVAAGFAYFLLRNYPLTLDLDTWYAPAGVFAVALVLLLAAVGLWSATDGGRGLVPRPVEEPVSSAV